MIKNNKMFIMYYVVIKIILYGSKNFNCPILPWKIENKAW